jgi:outer membrane protein assembly factor BamE (lipoprotein component of BamABCDE complex)
MFQINRFLVFVLMLGFLSGCASVGRKIDQSSADKIEKGKTTKQEVITLLGSPDRITRRANGDTMFSYKYARATAKPATFIPIFGPLVGGANVQHQFFIVLFGADGVVKDYISSQGSTETDRGFATGSRPAIPEVEQDKRPK